AQKKIRKSDAVEDYKQKMLRRKLKIDRAQLVGRRSASNFNDVEHISCKPRTSFFGDDNWTTREPVMPSSTVIAPRIVWPRNKKRAGACLLVRLQRVSLDTGN